MNLKIIPLILIIALVSMCIDGQDAPDDGAIKKFNSIQEIKDYLEKNTQTYGGSGRSAFMAMEESVVMMADSAPAAKMTATDFSTTNIQVEGVDEADIVKNDGKYIFVLSGNVLSIIDAYPAEGAELVTTIEIEGNPREIFLDGDRLVVLGTQYQEFPVPLIEKILPGIGRRVYPMGRTTKSFAKVYDISDKAEPELVRSVSVDGNYFDSRMIGHNVYVIATQYPYYGDIIRIPEIEVGGGTLTPDVYYFDEPDTSYTFTTILSINPQDEEDTVRGKVYLTGASQDMYVSQSNIYLTSQKWLSPYYVYERTVEDVIMPAVSPEVAAEIGDIIGSDTTQYEKETEVSKALEAYLNTLEEDELADLKDGFRKDRDALDLKIQKMREMTTVHRIEITGGNVEYKASGEVPGRVLNQFSMDEHNGHFRIATTTGQVWAEGARQSANHIFVLDLNLDIVGTLEDIAPGESIYSARFMGDRAYLVTFRKVDPLFVIDLSDPENPDILGKLKIPGYSDYLHPYDEDHIIGIGKEAVEAEEGDFAWYQGVKVALFDVSNVEKPKEISNYVIGDRGTDSEALRDHKAFLFSKEKNLMVMPIRLAEIDEDKYTEDSWGPRYGDYVWQGAYVFSVDTENGFVLKGQITHVEDEDIFKKSGYYFGGSQYTVRRSLYMDDTLYTISQGMVKMNDLGDLEEINKVELPSYITPEPVLYAEGIPEGPMVKAR